MTVNGQDARGNPAEGCAPVAIVTGGGRGIGACTARQLASRGYRVCIAWRADREAAEAIARDIGAGTGRALAVQCDVGVEADVLRLFAEVDRVFGQLDLLVNNAGIVAPKTRVEDLGLDRLTRMFQVNVIGSMLCAREAVRRMSTRHGGRGGVIVNVSSVAARLGSPNLYVDYAASKAAIDTFTYGLALEVADEGIRVNAVRPGMTKTDIHADSGDADRVEKLRDSIPMRRGGEPEEIAAAIVWLASGESSYVTGAVLDVSGGR